ncbi:hypothetical protein D9758_009500 [Tetrapyrgos nigripes]|uniref:Protein kinase domain-containing protein n=1 Tax=Tetrapyrgos nigripes TaxID=182062 RepID=A0A8H5LEL3_9AGAR|nr:hypothetical protein D9758_009500 [Tetrapyrgos nigripes]
MQHHRSSSSASRNKSKSPVRHTSDPLSSSVPNISLTPPTQFRNLFDSWHHPLETRGRTKERSSDFTIEVFPSTRESSAEKSNWSTDTPSPWLEKYSPRPWQMTPKKKDSVPKEQTEAYLKTRTRVQQATKSIIDISVELARTGLSIVGEAGEVLPVPGLGIAAKLLEEIWDAIEKVDSNRLACLRLAERCAEILLAVYEEVHSSGKSVLLELHQPLDQLIESFKEILSFVHGLNSQPFWKRYLKRDRILEQIDECNESLSDCLYMFNFRVLARILKNVISPANQDVTETSDPFVPGLLSTTGQGRSSDSPPISPITQDDNDTDSFHMINFETTSTVSEDDIASTKEDQIREHLRALQKHQNERDKARDLSDIRQLLATALEASSDKDMMRILKLARQDMPDAFKTLFKMITVPGKVHTPIPPGARELPVLRAFTWPLDEQQSDMLDAEILDRSQLINNLVTEAGMPSWTMSKSDITFQELAGRGFFSNVYKGIWRQSVWKRITVAIKVLEPSTPAEAFKAELDIWKSLKHPNVLPLFGSSDITEDTKFFVSPYMENGCFMDYLKRLEWTMGLGNDSSNKPKSILSPADEAVLVDVPESSRKKKTGVLKLGHELLGWMVEIAKGMEYLHKTVVHGDLKGANILIDHHFRCVIADFGHSKEFSQIDHTNAKHAHGFRWQSPELMAEYSLLTKENDVYAFAITCVEILTMGSLPWPMMPDDLVKQHVLQFDERPPFPDALVDTIGIRHLLDDCWSKQYLKRPSFSEIVRRLEALSAIREMT